PDVDNRYSDEKIVTHDGQEVHSVVLPTDDYVCNAKEVQEADVVLIDEAQFFDFIHIGVTSLLEKGKVVYCSGLDMDYRGIPFYEMSQLMGIADKVNKLKAVCSDCGDDSYITAKTSGTDSRVEIGSKDIYKPLCRKCYNKLQEESK
ncbi:thymidine kinase, partial [Priestia megaterium]|uniref:thymidine kinase n=1 Tax=Priestia megaterium TaxID=1404 RepID=UPI002E2185A4|nr:thymidine kinase [Priestia megaterium]